MKKLLKFILQLITLIYISLFDFQHVSKIVSNGKFLTHQRKQHSQNKFILLQLYESIHK